MIKSQKERLISAKETTDKSMQNSRKEAVLIVGDAELQADKILDSARKKVSRIEDEITRLTVLRNSFAVKLKGLLNSQIELLELFDEVNTDEEEKIVKKEFIDDDKPDSEPVIHEQGNEDVQESGSEEQTDPPSMMDDFLKEKSESNGPV